MTISHWIGLAGGLALFLYGIRLMGDGIQHLAGSKLKNALEKLTRNRIVGLFVGLFVTAIIQSSNATTSMAVGFVNAGLMDFARASSVILGANIGTTATGLLIALKISDIAPIIAFLGVILIVFIKNKHANSAGSVIAGLGILFIGMNMLKEFMQPLSCEPWFTSFMLSLESKPLLAILIGAVFTSIVQSVSASVGILQAMAMSGVVTNLDQVVFIILGMNIGCCVAAVTAAIGGTKDGKRTASIHVMFNVFAGALFVLLWKLLPLGDWIRAITPDVMQQIAFFNTVEKIVAAAIMFPMLPLMEKLARFVIRGADKSDSHALQHINRSDFGSISIAIAQVRAETERMFSLALDNLKLSCKMLNSNRQTEAEFSKITETEETIDYLNRAITEVLVDITSLGITDADAKAVNRTHHVISDYERIGDHADNIAGYVHHFADSGIKLSQSAHTELEGLTAKVISFVNDAQDFYLGKSEYTLPELEAREEEVDDIVDELQEAHIRRLENGSCSAEVGMLYQEILTDLERIADHAVNIAQAAEK